MKGFRFLKKEHLKDMLENKNIVNSRGEIHSYAANNFEKSRSIKCFWFFENLKDALASAKAIGYGADSVLVEFEFEPEEIYETGKGSYVGGSFATFREAYAVPEFTTLRIGAGNIKDIYYLDETKEYDDEGETYYSLRIAG